MAQPSSRFAPQSVSRWPGANAATMAREPDAVTSTSWALDNSVVGFGLRLAVLDVLGSGDGVAVQPMSTHSTATNTPARDGW